MLPDILKTKRTYRFSPFHSLCSNFAPNSSHLMNTNTTVQTSKQIYCTKLKGLATFFTPNTDQKYSLKIEVVSPCQFTTELLYRPDQLSSCILWTITEDWQPKSKKAALKPEAISQSLYNWEISCQNGYSRCYKLNTVKPLLGPKWWMHDAWFHPLLCLCCCDCFTTTACFKSPCLSAHQMQQPHMAI